MANGATGADGTDRAGAAAARAGAAGGTGGVGGALVAAVAGRSPAVDPAAYTAPTSVVLGDVVLAAGASVWYHAVLRGDCESIRVGAGSNIQDNCTVHADPGSPRWSGPG